MASVAHELLELVGASHEVRLAVDLDEHADAAAGVDVARHEALAGVAAGLAAAAARPFSRSSAVAFSTSPPVSSRACLQSMKPAPVRSRSSLTASALMWLVVVMRV